MIPTPDKRILVTSGKKTYPGTIAYTKNIDLREDGYIKLSPPLCRVYRSNLVGESDGSRNNSDFGLPYDLFLRDTGVYKVHTNGNAFELNMSSLSVTEDSGSGSAGSDGIRIFQWVSNLWFMNGASAVYSYDGSTVNSNYVSRIVAALDFITSFISRNTLVGRDASNVNILKQYNTSYSNTTDLTIPANYAITGAAFSNELMGVATNQRKNQGNAIFAVWDGADTSANSIHVVNDPYILDVAAYKNSWVIFTSRGQLMYFNGGGFDELGRLPNFDLSQTLASLTPTTSIVFGKLINVDGDRIYVSCASLAEIAQTRKAYSPFYSGGAYCYDPRNGFYHFSSPSYSEYDPESITFSSNVGTTSASHFLQTGDEMWAGTTSNEITAGKTYFAIKLTATTFSLAETYAEAIAGTVMTVTNASYTFYYVKRYDYGVESLKIVDCGTVRNERNFTGYLTTGALPFLMGAKVHPNDLTATRVNVLNVAVPVMHNRGYFVMGKYESADLEDAWTGVAVTYSKLKAQDKIVVKAKTKDCEPIVVGDNTLFSTSAYSGESVTWDSSGTYFATTADLTGAEEGDEVHVFAGPGAGQSAHIQTINGSVDAGWEVVLDEVIRGIVSGRVSCVSIDKFKKLGTITSDDTGNVKKFTVGDASPSMEIKIELRGIDVKVARVLPISSAHKLAV